MRNVLYGTCSLDAATDREVAGEVRAALAKRKIAVTDLAQHVGMSRDTLSKRINGARPLTVGELSLISNAIGIPASELLRRAEQSAENPEQLKGTAA